MLLFFPHVGAWVGGSLWGPGVYETVGNAGWRSSRPAWAEFRDQSLGRWCLAQVHFTPQSTLSNAAKPSCWQHYSPRLSPPLQFAWILIFGRFLHGGGSLVKTRLSPPLQSAWILIFERFQRGGGSFVKTLSSEGAVDTNSNLHMSLILIWQTLWWMIDNSIQWKVSLHYCSLTQFRWTNIIHLTTRSKRCTRRWWSATQLTPL